MVRTSAQAKEPTPKIITWLSERGIGLGSRFARDCACRFGALLKVAQPAAEFVELARRGPVRRILQRIRHPKQEVCQRDLQPRRLGEERDRERKEREEREREQEAQRIEKAFAEHFDNVNVVERIMEAKLDTFISKTLLGDESRVVRLLKSCNQSAIAGAVIELKVA